MSLDVFPRHDRRTLVGTRTQRVLTVATHVALRIQTSILLLRPQVPMTVTHGVDLYAAALYRRDDHASHGKKNDRCRTWWRSKSKLNLDILSSAFKYQMYFVKRSDFATHSFTCKQAIYLPLLPSRRASPIFGRYSSYRPTEGRRLSRPGWLVT